MTNPRTRHATHQPAGQAEAVEPSGAAPPFPPVQGPSRRARIRRAIARAAAASRAAHGASVHF